PQRTGRRSASVFCFCIVGINLRVINLAIRGSVFLDRQILLFLQSGGPKELVDSTNFLISLSKMISTNCFQKALKQGRSNEPRTRRKRFQNMLKFWPRAYRNLKKNIRNKLPRDEGCPH
ncbi:hypothetical protein A6R68_01435, partial [Neotoma lepida]